MTPKSDFKRDAPYVDQLTVQDEIDTKNGWKKTVNIKRWNYEGVCKTLTKENYLSYFKKNV